MVSKYDMKKFIEKNPDKFPYIYKEDEDAIYSKEGNYICSLVEFLKIYRKHSGESFECIYDEHISLEEVLRCTECGTVIFAYEDERYDPHLKCPTCTNYETRFKYWTKEDIDSDKEKQDVINYFKEVMDYRVEQAKRIKRRNGLNDWQITRKKIYTKKKLFIFDLECDDITKSYLKGLRLDVGICTKDEDGMFIQKKNFTIPLSWSQFYILFIYRHLGKCHPSLRSKWYIGKARD